MHKFYMTVIRNNEVIKEAVLESGQALASATLEVLEGNSVGLCLWTGGEVYDFKQFNYDLREERTVN